MSGTKRDLTITRPHKKPSAYCLRVTLGIFAALVVIAVAIVAIFAIIYSSNANAAHRYCVDATGPGTNASVKGSITMDINDRDISWSMQHTPDLGAVLSLHIMGPIPAGITTGPLNFALCGSPSSLACDLTTPNVLSGHIYELNPGGTALKPIIQAIRNEPWRFYLQVNTGVPGEEVFSSLGSICGTP